MAKSQWKVATQNWMADWHHFTTISELALARFQDGNYYVVPLVYDEDLAEVNKMFADERKRVLVWERGVRVTIRIMTKQVQQDISFIPSMTTLRVKEDKSRGTRMVTTFHDGNYFADNLLHTGPLVQWSIMDAHA